MSAKLWLSMFYRGKILFPWTQTIRLGQLGPDKSSGAMPTVTLIQRDFLDICCSRTTRRSNNPPSVPKCQKSLKRQSAVSQDSKARSRSFLSVASAIDRPLSQRIGPPTRRGSFTGWGLLKMPGFSHMFFRKEVLLSFA
jgi:hypothetical protein